MLKLLSTAGLAVVAVSVALASLPGAASAEGTSSAGGYCRFRDDAGDPKALVGEGELYKDTSTAIYNANLTAKRTTVYLCKRSQLADGSNYLELVELYSYCEGRACRYDLGEKPPPITADAGGGGWSSGSVDIYPKFVDPDYGSYGPMVDPIEAFG
jgi:hypothetical protein